MLVFKPGVDIRGLQPEMALGMLCLYTQLLPHSTDGKIVITSGTDGKHKINSLHYLGLAVDVRIWNIEQIENVVEAIKEDLPGFDLVLHRTHLHMEYQPKKPLNM